MNVATDCSIYGNDLDAFSLTTSTGFYNSEFGSTVASGINPAFIAFFPDDRRHHWHRQPERWRRSSHQHGGELPWINEAISANIVMDDYDGRSLAY